MAKLWVVGSITAVVFFLAGLSVATGLTRGNQIAASAASYQPRSQQSSVLPVGAPASGDIYVDGAVQKVAATGGGSCCVVGGGAGISTGAACH
jgi:hypothetical protein